MSEQPLHDQQASAEVAGMQVFPLGVNELIEIWRMGEFFRLWAENPDAITPNDMAELDQLVATFEVNGMAALYAFQERFRREVRSYSPVPVLGTVGQQLLTELTGSIPAVPEHLGRVLAALRSMPDETLHPEPTPQSVAAEAAEGMARVETMTQAEFFRSHPEGSLEGQDLQNPEKPITPELAERAVAASELSRFLSRLPSEHPAASPEGPEQPSSTAEDMRAYRGRWDDEYTDEFPPEPGLITHQPDYANDQEFRSGGVVVPDDTVRSVVSTTQFPAVKDTDQEGK